MVLNNAQAIAVYAAMVELNNVGAVIDARLPVDRIDAYVRLYQVIDADGIVVTANSGGSVRRREYHEDQAAFAKAYGLD